jgi:hypothetical protein
MPFLNLDITGYHGHVKVTKVTSVRSYSKQDCICRSIGRSLAICAFPLKPKDALIWVTVRPKGGSNEQQCISRYCSVAIRYYSICLLQWTQAGPRRSEMYPWSVTNVGSLPQPETHINIRMYLVSTFKIVLLLFIKRICIQFTHYLIIFDINLKTI